MAEQLTEEQFQTKVMGASEPVLVDFSPPGAVRAR